MESEKDRKLFAVQLAVSRKLLALQESGVSMDDLEYLFSLNELLARVLKDIDSLDMDVVDCGCEVEWVDVVRVHPTAMRGGVLATTSIEGAEPRVIHRQSPLWEGGSPKCLRLLSDEGSLEDSDGEPDSHDQPTPSPQHPALVPVGHRG